MISPKRIQELVAMPGSSHLIARPLASFVPHLYASPDYLRRMGEPAEPADLERHECLNILKDRPWILHRGKESAEVATRSRFTINNVGLICRLATLGMGVVLLTEELVVDELATGRLVRVLPQWHGKPVPVYALTETRLLPAKTQRFIEFLKERLAHA